MGCLSTNVLIHLITLPVEFDASKRALNILKKYVPNKNLKQCKICIKSCCIYLFSTIYNKYIQIKNYTIIFY